MASVTCPVCRSNAGDMEETCGQCGAPLPRRQIQVSPEPISESASISPQPLAGAEDGDPFARRRVNLRTPDDRLIPLEAGDRLVVGRSPESPLASICLDNISWRHAEIYVDEDSAYVLDTNSTNGTFVDGVRLPSGTPFPISTQTAIQLGSQPPLQLIIEVDPLR
jgi:FHA domain